MESDNAFHDFEHEGWQKAADQYGPGFGGATNQTVEPILNAAHVREGLRLLDVACGPGYVAYAAALRGCSVVGIDFSSAMIAVARRNYPELEFREGDAENLDFPSTSFDVVVMNFGMLHLARPDNAIAEAFRVLRNGGRFAFTVWDSPPKTAGFEVVLDAVRKHGNVNVALPEGPPFFRFSDPEESARTLKASGFAEIQSTVVPLIWTLQSGADLFATMRRAGVRTAALLNLQTPEALRDIADEIATQSERFEKNGDIALPMPAILTSAVKP